MACGRFQTKKPETKSPGPTMREFWNKGMSKPYRDRRKRSKCTKSVNVPCFSLWIEEESGEQEEQNRTEE
jgi:hypothetical protein